MAENETGQEKTEAPTSRRMSKARDEGNIPKSTEINNTIMLIAGVVAFYNLGGDFVYNVSEGIEYYFRLAAEYEINEVSYHALLINAGARVIYILAPFFAIFVIAALIANISQVGFLFIPNKLAPDPKKLDPIKGIKNLFNMRSRIELVKSVFKIFFITPVMIYFIRYRMPEFMNLPLQDTNDILTHVAARALEVSIWAIIIMLILAIADWIYQKWQNKDDLKMTKEEVKQEMKDSQGDPKIKSRIRSIQMEMARQRMMEEVPQAEVVVTNPTEFAVALKYQTGDMAAPQVVAKGRNHLARRIRKIAVENGVPIVENKPLAQSLWKLVEVGQFIPPDLYQAVAEVLAYVYRLTKKTGVGV
ncbi:MAG: flagellar biosynthesis protein FlhB [Candidatus Hinthialibacter antarcticus]|nr:flagellar biosynthesis protein FlhB [Candidatus Hinthialibacter antarcticus]